MLYPAIQATAAAMRSLLPAMQRMLHKLRLCTASRRKGEPGTGRGLRGLDVTLTLRRHNRTAEVALLEEPSKASIANIFQPVLVIVTCDFISPANSLVYI
jgi:hypothetical protein